MSQIYIKNAMIYRTSRRVFSMGEVLVEDGKILAVSEDRPLEGVAIAPDCDVVDAGGRMLIPGFVDVHTHGRAGGDFTTADEAMMAVMAESYLASGVTTVMPTLASAPIDDMKASIARIKNVATNASAGQMARFAGVHLEGRYLNPAKRGAHAPHLLSGLDTQELADLLSGIEGKAHLSVALELEGGRAFLATAKSMGATVGLGHTSATYAQAMAFIDMGVTSMTHLYNAMPPLHHRDGGAVCAGLLSPCVYCELICDGFHIAPEMVKLAYTLKGDYLTLITDSMEATGCADGEYNIAGMPVTVKDGKARTHDGAIAGSTLSMWEAVRNLRDFAEISLGKAIYAATMAPALQIGLGDEIGSLDIGKWADMILLDGGLGLGRVMSRGVWYDPAH